MAAIASDIVLEILRRLDSPDVAACRLACKEWRGLCDSVASRVRHDFLSCRPDCGKNSAYIEVRGAFSPVIRIGFERTSDAVDRESVAAACRIFQYKAITPSIPALGSKEPVYLSCGRRLSRGECLAVRGMINTLRTLDLRGVSAWAPPPRNNKILCDAISGTKSLLTLHMPAHDLNPSNIRALSNNRSITHLDLFQNAAGAEGCAALSRMASLETLNIGSNEIAGAGAQLSRLTNLSDLNVNFNGMNDDEVARMVSGLSSLKALRITWNDCGQRTKRALEGAPGLTLLDLSFTTRLMSEAIPSLGNLLHLEFNFAGLSDADAGHIARAKKIRTLKMSNNAVTGAGVRALCAGLRALTDLDLSWNEAGHEGALCIAEKLTRLRRLDMKRNDILDAGAVALMGLPGLEYLNISNNHVSGTVVRDMKHRAAFTLVALNR